MATDETAKHGNRYGDDVKERAYQIWALVASRKASRTAELLATDAYGDPVNVSVRTVNEWVHAGEWAARIDADLSKLAPDMRRQTAADLIVGATEAAAYLRAVVSDERIDHKHRLTAALGLLDRAGFSHVGSKPAPEIGPGGASNPAALPDLVGASTVDDLLRLEAQLRARRQAGRR